MITVRDRVETLVGSSPFLRQALTQDLINVSSLARQLHPQIRKDLKKPVSVDAVFMALKRYAATLETTATSADHRAGFGDLSLRNNLFEVTVANSDHVLSTVAALLTHSKLSPTSFLIFTKGSYETTITASESQREHVESWLQNEHLISERGNLTGISLQRRGNASKSGPVDFPLQIMAWQGISAVNVISTTNEITILLDNDDVDVAISALRAALSSSEEGARVS